MVLGSLHYHQREIFLDSSKIRVLACGARWGKDRLTILDMLVKCQWLATHERERRKSLIPAVLAWYVAPNYSLLRQSWEELQYFTAGVKGVKFNKSALQCFLPHGIEIEFKSADNPGRLLSRGLDYVAVTEAARMKKESWEKSLITRLSSPGRGVNGSGGMAILNSTPEGQNWFYDLYKQGQHNRNEGYIKSWRFTSYDNPYIDKDQLDKHKELLPEKVFRQEYLAEFIAGGGSVFRRLGDAWQVYPYPQLPEKDEWGIPYTIGIDWGRHTDSTAVTVIKHDVEKCRLVNHLILTGIGYAEQIEAIKRICEQYPEATVIPESNGLGDPLVEQLKQEINNPVLPFTTTATSKKNIIESLAYILETGGLELPAQEEHDVLSPVIPEIMEQLTSYEVKASSNGILSYSAPSGKHDDCVMSLAFAVCGKQQNSSKLEVIRSA